jgi:hydroxyacylglutathione hydrolase
MLHEILPVGMLACNCSVLADEATKEAVVIDPGDEVDRVQRILALHDLKVRYIIATHAHIDHVGGLKKLHDITGAPVLMHEADMPLYENLAGQAAWLGVETPGMADMEQFLKEGDRLRWGALSIEVLHTPGHSPGSISLHLSGEDAHLFAGDTLFQGSVGRWDLWGGSEQQLLRSIQKKLLLFPDETLVFPGHGLSTTIGHERESNPFLQNL